MKFLINKYKYYHMKFTTISILMICTGIFQKIIVQILFIKINKKKEKKNEKLLSIDVVLS
jgi:hypothetical protein